MRLYKKSMEEATDNANQAMTKFRKVAHELDEANERAEVAEAAVSKARTKAKELWMHSYWHSNLKWIILKVFSWNKAVVKQTPVNFKCENFTPRNENSPRR